MAAVEALDYNSEALFRQDGARIGRHDGCGVTIELSGQHGPAQVSVCHHADHLAIHAQNRDAALAAFGNREDHILHTGVGRDDGDIVWTISDVVARRLQRPTEFAPRMAAAEIFPAESAPVHQEDGECVAKGEGHGGGRGGGEAIGAGFGDRGHVQHDVGQAPEGRVRGAGHADNRDVMAAAVTQEVDHLTAFAGIGYGEHDRSRRDHAEVAMAGFGWVQEE